MESQRLILIFVAELIGTMSLLFFGCLGGLHEKQLIGPLLVPLHWGFVVSSIIAVIGFISEAHINPCVTLCAVIKNRVAYSIAIIYFIAQILGATVGIALAKVLASPEIETLVRRPAEFCSTQLNPSYSIWQGLLAEFMGTSLLISLVCSSWDKRNAHQTDSMAIKFGLMLAAIVTTIGDMTGASLNPARTLGPALINGVWSNHWIYWISPISATILTTLLYEFLFTTNEVQSKIDHPL